MRAVPLGLLLELLARGVDGRSGSDLVGKVTIEVYYSPRCTRCWSFLQRNVLPLLEAGLPGDQVLVTVLPVPFTVLMPGDCVKDAGCVASVAPLCALNNAPPPAPADSPELRAALRFVECSVGHTSGELHLDRHTVRNCSEAAGVPMDGIDDCIASKEVFDFMHSKSYNENAIEALARISEEGFDEHVGLPLVFVDGVLLSCDGHGCSARKKPSGEEPLQRPGSLLSVACARLQSPPEACRGAGADPAAGPVDVSDRLPCENCAEVGRFRWRAVSSSGPWGQLALAAGALAALSLALVAWHRGRRPQRGRGYEAPGGGEPAPGSLMDARGGGAELVC